jgi:hypothetical protein
MEKAEAAMNEPCFKRRATEAVSSTSEVALWQKYADLNTIGVPDVTQEWECVRLNA